MGITYQTFNLLKKNIEEFGNFDDLLTLGRLGNQIGQKKLKLLNLESDKNFQHKYSDDILINHLNAKSVDSIDNSSFEGASIIHDMNTELKIIDKQYDVILDIGTSEHIFNINQNLINISKLCKKGGRIIHCLPANNQCGHGFWQFSPEMFFSLYSEVNGYQSTKLYLIDTYDYKNYWEINRGPKNERLELNSYTPLYIFVSTIKILENTKNKAQQSDYDYIWNNHSNKNNTAVIQKSYLSILSKKIKDNIKSYLRNNFFLKNLFIKYENKKLFLKNFFKKDKNLTIFHYETK